MSLARRFGNLLDAEQVLVWHARLIVGALGAVGAILGASASLDGKQLAKLNFGGIVELAMDLLRGKNQIQ